MNSFGIVKLNEASGKPSAVSDFVFIMFISITFLTRQFPLVSRLFRGTLGSRVYNDYLMRVRLSAFDVILQTVYSKRWTIALLKHREYIGWLTRALQTQGQGKANREVKYRKQTPTQEMETFPLPCVCVCACFTCER